ncbi:MAG: PepSY domain-containing protein [Gemmatimonadota bacterium]
MARAGEGKKWSFGLVTRRTHAYLALALLPWVAMYGLTAVAYSHTGAFSRLEGGRSGPDWQPRFERPFDLPLPASEAPVDDGELRRLGERVLEEAGLRGAFAVSRPQPERLVVSRYDFRSTTRLTYDAAAGRLVAEDRAFRLDPFMRRLHARAGFTQASLLDDAWGAIVDLVALGFLVWIASGIYMWIRLRRCRLSGGLALGGGILAFVLFLFGL